MKPAMTEPTKTTMSLTSNTSTNGASSRETMWEGRIWTVMQTLMVAAMLWVASTLFTLSQTITRIEERVSTAVLMQQLKDKMQDASIEELRRVVDTLQTRGGR